MKLPLTGGCLCGGIRYEITRPRSWFTPVTARIASTSQAVPSRLASLYWTRLFGYLEKCHESSKVLLTVGALRAVAFAPIAPRLFAGNRDQEHWCRQWSGLFWAARSTTNLG
jgi:hypothetical protein